jgi:hypothetical protein
MWAIHGINHRISWHSNFPWKQADLLDLGLSENKAPQSPMGSYNIPMLKGYFGVDDIFRHSHLVHVFHEPSHLSWTNMRKKYGEISAAKRRSMQVFWLGEPRMGNNPNNVLLVKIEGPVWYTIYHLPVVKGVNKPFY